MNLKEEIRKSLKDDKNPCEAEIMKKLEEIIHYPLPKNILFVIKNFIEVISIMQGQLNAVLEMCIKQEIEIKLLQNKSKGD